VTRGSDKRGPGRPPVLDQAERKRRVLDAAEALFTERGFTHTNMDHIAGACGMSKQTVYGLFPSKDALFAALVEESVPSFPEIDCAGSSGLEEELVGLLETIARHTLSRRQIAMTRLVVEETRAAPELSRSFHERGVTRGRAFLTDQLARLAVRRGVDFGLDPQSLSDILFGASAGGAMVHALIGDAAAAARDSTSERIRAIARLVVGSVVRREA